MRRNTGIEQLIKSNHDQKMDGALFAGHRTRHQLVDKPLKLTERTQYAKAQLLQQRFVFIADFLLQRGQNVAQRLTLFNHLLDSLGGQTA